MKTPTLQTILAFAITGAVLPAQAHHQRDAVAAVDILARDVVTARDQLPSSTVAQVHMPTSTSMTSVSTNHTGCDHQDPDSCHTDSQHKGVAKPKPRVPKIRSAAPLSAGAAPFADIYRSVLPLTAFAVGYAVVNL